MNAEDLRRLKHELRTPVNHIVGYSDLLLEVAGESGDCATADLAKDIHESGQKLAKLLEKSLLSPAGQMDDAQIDALCDCISPTVKHILDTVSQHSIRAAVNSETDELDRIRRAADQLLALVGKDRIAISK